MEHCRSRIKGVIISVPSLVSHDGSQEFSRLIPGRSSSLFPFLKGMQALLLCEHFAGQHPCCPCSELWAGVSSGLWPPPHWRTHFSGQENPQVPFGDRGALMRGSSKVRALCPVGMRVTEEEPAQDVWDVWAG